jgi:hypothetical protein
MFIICISYDKVIKYIKQIFIQTENFRLNIENCFSINFFVKCVLLKKCVKVDIKLFFHPKLFEKF